MASNTRIFGISQNLEAAKAKDIKPFGAEEHSFVLEPALNHTQVAEFETRWHVELPQEYRDFITKVGNGGAGPAYGMFSLSKAMSYRGMNLPADFLSSPFPYQSLYNPYDDPNLTEYWQRSVSGDVTKDEYESRKLKEVAGTLVLCHEGCGYLHLLIVSGSARGQMWLDATVSDGGYVPLEVGFLDWYERWLDDALAGGEGTWWMSESDE